jgi:CheY-like chemotaxis protein
MNFPSRVLVVDDDPLQQAILSEWLSNHGCQTVQSAYDGKQAIDLTQSNGSSLDLIILDLSLPRQCGVDQVIPPTTALGSKLPLAALPTQRGGLFDFFSA